MPCSLLRSAALIAALTLFTGSVEAASDRPDPRLTSAETASPRVTAPVDDLFVDLAAVEDPALEEHVAAGLSTTELIVVIVTLILFFPLGIILLIVFLVSD